MPWAAYEQDSRGIVVRDSQNNPKLTGYCVEFVEEMSKKMNFEYELIVPTDGSETYGSKSRYEHQSTVSFFLTPKFAILHSVAPKNRFLCCDRIIVLVTIPVEGEYTIKKVKGPLSGTPLHFPCFSLASLIFELTPLSSPGMLLPEPQRNKRHCQVWKSKDTTVKSN